MKKNKIISVFAILAMMTIMLTGCGSDPIKDDISNYVDKQMPSVSALEKSVTADFNAVSGDNYSDDSTMLSKVEDVVIPNSNKLIEAAKAVVPETAELKALHEKYIAAKTLQNQGFALLVIALEEGNGDAATESNNMLVQADTQIGAYATELKALAKDHGLELTQ